MDLPTQEKRFLANPYSPWDIGTFTESVGNSLQGQLTITEERVE